MRRFYLPMLLATQVASFAHADVKVVRSVQTDSAMGFGGGPKQMIQWTAADRQREEQNSEGKPSLLERLAGVGKPVITRLDKKVRWTINPPKKTYEEMSLVAPKTADEDSKSDADKNESSGREEKPTTKVTKAEFKVTPLNQKKRIGSFECEGYVMRTVLEMEDLESHERSEMKMITTLWNTPDVGAVVQLKRQEEAYAKAYWQTMGLDASAQASMKMLGTAMFASMAGANEGELSKALKGMPAELKKLKGYPISTRVEWYGKDEEHAAQEVEQETTEIPTDVSDALGSFAAGFAKKKMEAKKPAATAEGQLMFAMTTTIQSIETNKIAADVFEVPSGYKAVKH